MERTLDGRVALVTGASRGIGRAIAVRLGGAGARVYVNYRSDHEGGAETVRRAEEAGGSAAPLAFDVADSEAVSNSVGEILSNEGRLDVLVNNAGVAIDNLLLRLKAEDWDQVMSVNLRGTFNCTRAAVRSMLRAHFGRIVNLSSVIGLMGNAGQSAYAAAKAGLLGFTKATAREVASRNITVNAVAPGLIETEMVAHLPEARRTEYLNAVPAGRFGTPDEVAELVAFLVRADTSYITGQVISINGGLYM
jgi:3-oxoacyl-[acyl-carrier protein] reductase